MTRPTALERDVTPQIAIIGASTVLARMVRRYLEEASFEVREVEDARDWLDAPSGPPPALLICDVDLVRGDGVAFLAELRANGSEIPVIVWSHDVFAHPEHARRSLARLGVRIALPKPFGIGMLLAAVREALEES